MNEQGIRRSWRTRIIEDVLRLRSCRDCYALVRAAHVGLHEGWHKHTEAVRARETGET